jgi:hypothetical protein
MDVDAPRPTTRPASVALWAAVLCALLLALAAGTGTWYETSDDVGMNAGVAGGYGIAAPDEHLVFSNVLVGLVLKTGYRIAPTVPWYGLYLLATLAAAAVAFLWALSGLLRSWSGRMLLAAFLIGTITTTVGALQFTRVGLLAAASGWLLIASAIAGRIPAPRAATIAGSVLVFVASLIRVNTVYLAALLAAPLVLAAVISSFGMGWRHLLRVFIAIAVMGTACLAASSFSRSYYRTDPAWERFFAFQQRRMMFIDLGRIDEDRVPPAVLDHVGWSRNDLGLMQDWFGLHPDVYSLDKQDYIIDQAARRRDILGAASVDNLRPLSKSPLVWLFAAIALAALVRAVTPVTIGAVALSLALFAGAMGTLAVTWHLPPRLFESAASIPAMTGLAVLAWRAAGGMPISHDRYRVSFLAIVAAEVLATVTLGATWTHAQSRAEDHRQIVANLERLHPDPRALYVTWAEDFRHQDLVTPLGGFSEAGAFHVFGVGWSNHAPVSIEGLHRAGADDPYVALWQRPHTFLIATLERCQRLVEFIAVHYGQILACSTVDAPLSVLTLSPVSVHGPSIGVRWSERVSDDARRQLEVRYGLQRPRSKGDRTWRYELTDTSPDLVRRLVGDGSVDDTSGINRETGAIVRPEPDW